ncbi:MAG: TetR/AcrR family transcriptional regulator [Planctomycetaceae bacterium]
MTGRPRDFDEVAVLDAAMNTFWNQGFDATSYNDLVEATGLGRQSLYQAFGDKRSLFTAVLRHYGQRVTQKSVEILDRPGASTQNIRDWLNRLRENSVRDRNGCLLTNTAVEIVPHDPDVAAIVQRELQRVENALRSAVKRALDCGELPEQTDAGEMATYLFGIAQGLMVMGRLGLSRAKLKRYTTVALAVLNG